MPFYVLLTRKNWHLVFVHVILQFCLSQLVECDNDQGHKNVDEKEWKHYEEYYVEDGHFHSEPGLRPLSLVS